MDDFDHNEMVMLCLMNDFCDVTLAKNLRMFLTGLRHYHPIAFAELLDTLGDMGHAQTDNRG